MRAPEVLPTSARNTALTPALFQAGQRQGGPLVCVFPNQVGGGYTVRLLWASPAAGDEPWPLEILEMVEPVSQNLLARTIAELAVRYPQCRCIEDLPVFLNSRVTPAKYKWTLVSPETLEPRRVSGRIVEIEYDAI